MCLDPGAAERPWKEELLVWIILGSDKANSHGVVAPMGQLISLAHWDMHFSSACQTCLTCPHNSALLAGRV